MAALHLVRQSYLGAITRTILAPSPAPVYALAYGSAVFPQQEQRMHKPPDEQQFAADKRMIDLLLAVDDPYAWHKANMQRNPHHYAPLVARLGARAAAAIQTLAAGVYYNTLVDLDTGVLGGDNPQVKYGVVCTARLRADLESWECMYVPGRLQKPTLVLQQNAAVALSQASNVASALRIALLMLPAEFSTHTLYCTIAGLSYTGDFRMSSRFPRPLENLHKVAAIADAQHVLLENMYRPVACAAPFAPLVAWPSAGGTTSAVVRVDPEIRPSLIAALPKALLARLEQLLPPNTLAQIKMHAAADHQSANLVTRPILEQALYQTIANRAWTQSAKGLLTAGWKKSTVYCLAKLRRIGSI